jgi:hypothetical protein
MVDDFIDAGQCAHGLLGELFVKVRGNLAIQDQRAKAESACDAFEGGVRRGFQPALRRSFDIRGLEAADDFFLY